MTFRRRDLAGQLQDARLAVIDALYAAAMDPGQWPFVAKAVSALVGGGSMSGLLHRTGAPLSTGTLLGSDVDPHYGRLYGEHYGAVNPWAHDTTGTRETLLINDSVTTRERLERSEFYNDWLRPQDLRYTFNICVRLDEFETIELVNARSIRIGPFERIEQDVIASLMPHLRRAVAISRRIALAEAGQRTAMMAANRSGTGSIIVDARQRVLFSDPEAERILRTGGLSIRQGRLRAAGPADGRLGAALAQATGRARPDQGRSGDLLSIPRIDHPLLSVAVCPLGDESNPLGLAGSHAIVLVTAPERSAGPTEEGLRALFGFTAAEARLVVALCAGKTLADHSDSCGTSLNTVKTHLKHVFEKTGVTRQADLVRRITTDVALRPGTGEGTL
jgi:DNA-binding CsgD family transcriptional regulator